MKIKVGDQFKDFDLDTMSPDALLDLKLRLEEEIDDIKRQITEARAYAAAENVYADRDWYWAAVTAQRKKGRQVQAIQLALKKKKQRPRIRSVPDAFMDIARAWLPSEMFQEMFEEAKERYDSYKESADA